MITKDQYCWVIIEKFRLENPQYQDVETKDLVKYIFQSTNLGLALQHLGFIDPDSDAALYLSNRGGVTATYTAFYNDKYKELIKEGRYSVVPEEEHVQILTMREILDMLPDTLEEKSND